MCVCDLGGCLFVKLCLLLHMDIFMWKDYFASIGHSLAFLACLEANVLREKSYKNMRGLFNVKSSQFTPIDKMERILFGQIKKLLIFLVIYMKRYTHSPRKYPRELSSQIGLNTKVFSSAD